MNRFISADPQICIGCHSCEIACVLSHNDGHYPKMHDQFLPRIEVMTGPAQFTALTCRHCEDAPCVTVCTPGALVKQSDAIKLIKDKCIGCKDCVMACPFGAISMVEARYSASVTEIIAHKCDLCEGHRDHPACVDACPADALHFYDMDQIEAERQNKQALSAFGALGKRNAPPVKRNLLENVKPRTDATKKSLEIRTQTFDEIYQQFTKSQLQEQAGRCLTCGDHAICEWTCPLHNRIPHWIQLAKEGRIIEAAELSHSTNSLPEICGRVCPQERLCEGACTLNNKNNAVTIGNIERYITETALAMGWQPDLSQVVPTTKRVAVIGAGPAGLACADVLARNGINASVFDRHPEIGGMLTFGIPAFKLEKSVMTRRRELFSAMGIEFQLNTEIGNDLAFDDLLEDYDAVFVGVGAYKFMRADLENEEAPGVYEALPFLTANTKVLMGLPELAHQPYASMAGKRVVVLGGGDTAMDCVRTSVRQGASQVICAYRRDEANMPGSKKEVNNAREEGVEFMFNLQPIKISVDGHGNVMGINMLRTELGEADAQGRRRPRPIEGSEFLLEADAVIVAFGFQSHEVHWLTERGVTVDKWGAIQAPLETFDGLVCQTAQPKIFAGGDAVRGADLVVTAISDGRAAAHSIIEYLQIQPVSGKEAL